MLQLMVVTWTYHNNTNLSLHHATTDGSHMNITIIILTWAFIMLLQLMVVTQTYHNNTNLSVHHATTNGSHMNITIILAFLLKVSVFRICLANSKTYGTCGRWIEKCGSRYLSLTNLEQLSETSSTAGLIWRDFTKTVYCRVGLKGFHDDNVLQGWFEGISQGQCIAGNGLKQFHKHWVLQGWFKGISLMKGYTMCTAGLVWRDLSMADCTMCTAGLVWRDLSMADYTMCTAG